MVQRIAWKKIRPRNKDANKRQSKDQTKHNTTFARKAQQTARPHETKAPPSATRFSEMSKTQALMLGDYVSPPHAQTTTKRPLQAAIRSTTQKKKKKKQLGSIIGKGGYGSVFQGVNIKTGSYVAIKQIQLSKIPKDQLSGIVVRFFFSFPSPSLPLLLSCLSVGCLAVEAE